MGCFMRCFELAIDRYNYIIQEEYCGRNIYVNVHESWSSNGIENAIISCPKYDSSSSFLGHMGNTIKDTDDFGNNIFIINRLTIDEVHNAIFKEIYLAEKSICDQMGEEHDGFCHLRNFNVVVEYKNQKIIVGLMLKPNFDIAWVSCPSCAQIKTFRIENNSYAYAIYDEVKRCKKLIDSGYIFPELKVIDKVKRKVRGVF